VDVTEKMVDEIAEKYYDKYLKIGLSTEPCDLQSIIPVINKLYESEGANENPEVVLVSSPGAAMELIQNRNLEYHIPWAWGASDAYWIAFYLAGEELGVVYDEHNLEDLHRMETLLGYGPIHFYDNLVVVSDRPSEIHLIETPNGPMLHREGGCAIKYRDGWGDSSLWDIQVPNWLAAGRAEDLDISKVMNLQNVDHRRVGIRRIGIS